MVPFLILYSYDVHMMGSIMNHIQALGIKVIRHQSPTYPGRVHVLMSACGYEGQSLHQERRDEAGGVGWLRMEQWRSGLQRNR